ncbi:MAG: 30S ribosomal protein S4 [Hadesarchaea archaeon]|nr:30S ribosomal protein S4 [Hadesarchaea archaeon]
MGDPKRQRKQYSAPLRPWDGDRIQKETKLVNQYGLQSKKEVWKTETILRDFRRKARRLMAASGSQAEKESKQILEKLQRLGLLDKESTLVDVLRLDIEDVLARRLQTIVYNKRLARTPNQARQMIVHGHILIEDKCVTVPGYLTTIEEERKVEIESSAPYEKIPEEETKGVRESTKVGGGG